MSKSGIPAAGGRDYSPSRPRNAMFASFMLALATLSNLNPCSASPIPMPDRSALTTRALWRPSAGATWNYQLTGTINVAATNVDVWDIDLFDASSATIDSIHAKGKRVICYFSAGSIEDWRPDASKFQASDKGSAVEGWQGENWLRTKSTNVRNIMLARLDLAAKKKCDGVEPDNVDGFDNSNGLGLTQNDAVDYVTFLANAAHARNLAVGLKNAGSIVPRLVNTVDYSVQEECVQYGDCLDFQPFIQQNKPVFHVEYSGAGSRKREAHDEDEYSAEDSTDNYSAGAATGVAANPIVAPVPVATSSKVVSGASSCGFRVSGFSSIMKNLDLNAWIQRCS
jgi:hypothetical protein